MSTYSTFRRLGLMLSFALMTVAPGISQDLGEPVDPSFRVDVLRQESALPFAQTPPYEWSAVHLRNAFQVDPNAPDFVMDSSSCSVGQPGGDQFDEAMRAYYQYDMQGRLSEVLFREKTTGGAFENYSRKSFQYTDGLRTEYLFERWDNDNSQWEPAYRETTTLNPEGRPSTFTLEEKEAGGAWTGIRRDSSLYTTDGYLEEVYRANWTGSMWEYADGQYIQYNELGAFTHVYELEANGSAWDSVMRINAQYGSLGLIWVGYQMAENTPQGWQPRWRETYQYDTYGFWSGMIRESWDEQGNAWENDTRETFDYTRKGIWTDWQQEAWADTGWVPLLAKVFQNNANGRLDILRSWNVGQNDWQNEQRVRAEYDNAQNLVREAGPQVWQGGAWVNDSSTRECQHFWSEASTTHISRPVSPQQLSCVMTNPYPAYAPIWCEDLQAGRTYEVQLTDLRGRPVFQQKLEQAGPFVIGHHLPTGVYQLNIFEGSTLRFSQKLLIQN